MDVGMLALFFFFVQLLFLVPFSFIVPVLWFFYHGFSPPSQFNRSLSRINWH
jgi:hypothetical protein